MSLIIEGLANTIHDILYINQNCLSYYDGSDYSQYMDFYYYALKGLSSSTLSLIQTTNKWNDKFIYSKKLADFQKGYVELRSLFNTCWKGNKKQTTYSWLWGTSTLAYIRSWKVRKD